MTDELLQHANSLKHTINGIEAQIKIVEEMHHCDNNLQLRCEDIGAISIAGDDELKDDIIDMILSRLNHAKEAKEDEYRML